MAACMIVSRVSVIRSGRSSVRSPPTGRLALAFAIAFVAGTGRGDSPSVIVHGVDATRAQRIADHAEAVRRAACAALLRVESPAAWAPRCLIQVHLTSASFAGAVGGQPVGARGATSIEFSGDAVSLRRIDVMGDGPEVIPDALAHELVHVVLADRFTELAPPRWADEGLALLFDAEAKQAAHDGDFRRAQAAGGGFTAADILALEHYPSSPARQRVFYGQAAALTRWLVARDDAAAFVDFLDDASRTDVASALLRHYGLETLASLDAAWKEVPSIQTFACVAKRH